LNHIDAELKRAIAAEYGLCDQTYILRSIENDRPEDFGRTKRRYALFSHRREQYAEP